MMTGAKRCQCNSAKTVGGMRYWLSSRERPGPGGSSWWMGPFYVNVRSGIQGMIDSCTVSSPRMPHKWSCEEHVFGVRLHWLSTMPVHVMRFIAVVFPIVVGLCSIVKLFPGFGHQGQKCCVLFCFYFSFSANTYLYCIWVNKESWVPQSMHV